MIPEKHDGSSDSGRSTLVRYPCSLGQQRFWFLEQLEPGNPALNVAVRWLMKGVISEAAVQRTFQALLERHEILRTRFVDNDGQPQQVVEPHSSGKITIVDLSRLTPAQRTQETEAISLREARRPFDLAAGPPVRLAMLRLDERSLVILLTMHHIATDGWTMGILSREFGALVAAAMAGTTPALPSLEMQFADYALWQSDMIVNKAFESDAEYWRTALGDVPRFEVPPDFPRPATLGTAGDFRLRNPPADLMAEVEALARRQGQTMYTLAASALALALAAETGRSDIVMGTQVAGRDDLLLEPIAGLFINTLVLRFDLQAAATAADVNVICRQVIDGAMMHQTFPFEKLVELLNPPRDASRTPLFSVNFTLIRPVVQTERFGDLELVSMPSQLTGAQYDLLFFMVKRDDGWRMVCESSSALYLTTTADRILVRWEEAFRRLLDAPASPLSGWTGLDAKDPRSAQATIGQSPSLAGKVDLQDHILAIWQELLGDRTLTPSSHFFESGGHSLLALRMLARVRALTGRPVAVATLFQHPVLSDFVGSMRADVASETTAQIARIQPAGTRPPVIALNDGAIYHPVAHHIGLDRPFISLHLADFRGTNSAQTRTFEELAAEAVRLIKQAQPKGPYTLLGHCVFGAVAFEAAQQLRRSGDRVSLVVLLDTLAPGYVDAMPWYDRIQRRLQLLGSSRRYFLQLAEKLRSGELSLEAVLFQYGFMRRNGILRLLERMGFIKRLEQTAEQYAEVVFGNQLLDASRDYRLRPYAGDVLQFRAETARRGRLFDEGFGWARWIAGTYDVITVPSDHFNMMREPAANVIGRHIAERLARIEASRQEG